MLLNKEQKGRIALKKKLSFLLTILLLVNMVLGMFPTFAEPNDTTFSSDAAAVAEGNCFRVGTEYYTDLDDAIAAVEDYGTIYQIADHELTVANGTYLGQGKNFTLDGQILNKEDQYTLSITAGGTYPLTPTRNVTIKNLNLYCNNSILMFTPQKEGDCFTLENVKAVTVAENRPFLLAGGNVSNAAKSVLGRFIIKDCEITGKSAPFFVGNTATSSWDIDIINSTLENGNATSSYPYAVLLYKSPSIDLTVDGTSKLLNTSTTSTAPNAIKVSTSTANDPKACVITLEEGATLGLKSESGAPAGSFIAKGSDTATYVLNDKGANYVASAYMQKKGVTLPTVTALDSAKLDEKGSFTAGSVTVADAGTYTNASATAEITLAYMGGTTYTPAEDDVIVTSDFNYYKNLSTAASELYEYGTMHVLKDFTDSSQVMFNKAVTIDGGGHEVTLTNGGYAWQFRSSTVLKNITITDTAYSAINFAPYCDEPLYVMDDVQGTTTNETRPFLGIGVGSNPANIATVADVIIKDSTLSGYAPVFVGNDGISSFNVDIINSTLTNPKASNSYPYVILLYKSPMINLTVDGTSKLINSSTDVTYSPTVIQVGSNDSNAPQKCNVTLKKGVELGLTSASGAPEGEFIRVNDGTKKLAIEDLGAKYTASAYMQQKGVTLPQNTVSPILGYRANGTLYEPTIGKYVDEQATEEITFEAEPIELEKAIENGFAMMAGASTRTQLPYGLRFTATLSKQVYETLLAVDSEFECGMIVARTRKVVGDFNLEGMSVADYDVIPCTSGIHQLSEDTYVFRHGIYGFEKTKEDFTTAYSAIAYITIHLADGTTQTFYTEYDRNENSRSIYNVAAAAVQSGVSDPFLNSILSVCSES